MRRKNRLEELIEQINKLFEGAGLKDEDQINAISSIMRHAMNDPQLQREAMANGHTDFSFVWSSRPVPSQRLGP